MLVIELDTQQKCALYGMRQKAVHPDRESKMQNVLKLKIKLPSFRRELTGGKNNFLLATLNKTIMASQLCVC